MESIQNFSMHQPAEIATLKAEIATLKAEIAPKSGESQNRSHSAYNHPLGGDFDPVEDR